MTSSQCDPRPGQDDAIGGDARERSSPEPKPGYQLTRGAAIDWARNCAKPGPGGAEGWPSYLPRSQEEAETWSPPDWLILTIQGAYARGQRNADTPAAAPPSKREHPGWSAIVARAASFIEVTKAFHDGAQYLTDAIDAEGVEDDAGETFYVIHSHGVHVEHVIHVELSDGARLVFDIADRSYMFLKKDES